MLQATYITVFLLCTISRSAIACEISDVCSIPYSLFIIM